MLVTPAPDLTRAGRSVHARADSGFYQSPHRGPAARSAALPTNPAGDHGPAVPPVIAPAAWEDYPIFRETFLLYVSDPEFNAALRAAGDFFFGMLLNSYGDWPEWPESSTRTELRAAVADLRHLQGFLASVGQERHLSCLDAADAKLSKHAAGVARLLKQVADTIERKLGKAGAA